jgi:hypothetical protein
MTEIHGINGSGQPFTTYLADRGSISDALYDNTLQQLAQLNGVSVSYLQGLIGSSVPMPTVPQTVATPLPIAPVTVIDPYTGTVTERRDLTGVVLNSINDPMFSPVIYLPRADASLPGPSVAVMPSPAANGNGGGVASLAWKAALAYGAYRAVRLFF